MRILITAGPTREYLDPVRYLSNDSSGKMGIELANEALRLKASVTLIHGPIASSPKKGVRCLPVVSAREMFAAVKRCHRSADMIICAAAVADFRPAKFSKHKIKKTYALKHLRTYALKLIPNPDILKWLGRHKRKGQLLIGFALETCSLLKNARTKLKKKNADIIVANLSNAIGKSLSSVVVITKSGMSFAVKDRPKRVIARNIINLAQKYQNS